MPDRPLKTSHAYALYDIFEITVEQSLDSLSMLLMHIEELPAGSRSADSCLLDQSQYIF